MHIHQRQVALKPLCTVFSGVAHRGVQSTTGSCRSQLPLTALSLPRADYWPPSRPQKTWQGFNTQEVFA